MTAFDEVFSYYLEGEKCRNASPDLKPLLKQLHDRYLSRPADLKTLKLVLRDLFVFLSSPKGKTQANCWMVDRFLSDHEGKWKLNLSHLPQEYQDILDEAQALHGAADEPQFHTAPEEIL